MDIESDAYWFGVGGANTDHGEWMLNLSGDVDFDDTVFGHLEDGTWTAQQAQWIWQYSDGYRVTLKATTLKTADARTMV